MIEDNIKHIQRVIAETAEKVGRNASDITLMAVTKTFGADYVKESLRCGLTVCGESKIQEAKLKILEVGEGAKWHLIGHLQRNKVKEAVKLFDVIESVDSVRLIEEINKRASAVNKVISVLLEVNISEEESKYGFTPKDISTQMDDFLKLGNVKIEGFMTMAPYTDDESVVRGVFAGLRILRDSFRTKYNNQELFPVLSMGMSHDFVIAIEEGATQVRVGSAIFGGRYYG